MAQPDEVAMTQAFAEALQAVGLSETAQGAVLRTIALFREKFTGEISMATDHGGCRSFRKTEVFNGAELSVKSGAGGKWSIT